MQTKNAPKPIQMIQGSYPHVYWIDLHRNGTAIECVVLKRTPAGEVMFIRVDNLDPIDTDRLGRIISSPRAMQFELWDLMSQQVLSNGQNALTYFHQLVKILSPTGHIRSPHASHLGLPADMSPVPVNAPGQQQVAQQQQAAAQQSGDVVVS